MKRKQKDEELIDLLKTWTADEIGDYGKKMAGCVHSAEDHNEARLIYLLRTMSGEERREFKAWIFDSIKSARRSVPQSNPRDDAIAELYAVKSFQAQDMSGRFNRSRMKQAIKEANAIGKSKRDKEVRP